ncbi:MAG: DALR domain-containing protein [Segetibacter sp.]
MQSAEKGLKRLWEAHEALQKMKASEFDFDEEKADAELDTKVQTLLDEFDEFMNDDFNTAKVLANMFEIVPVINSIKDKHIPASSLNSDTFHLDAIENENFCRRYIWFEK